MGSHADKSIFSNSALRYSGDTRTVNTLYLFVHFFSDHRMLARPFAESIYCFYTLKMPKTSIIRRAFIS